MNLKITANQFPNISEIWGVGSNSIEVITRNHKHYCVIAQENIRSGTTSNYVAAYEQLEKININSTKNEIWIRVTSLPSAYGDTIEGCLLHAIYWLDQQE